MQSDRGNNHSTTNTRSNTRTRLNYFTRFKMNAPRLLLSTLNDQMKLFTIPISLGLMYISYQKFRQLRKDQKIRQPVTRAEPNLVTDMELNLLKFLPLRTCSRSIGYLSCIRVPKFLRSTLYGSFCAAYDCTINEALDSDFASYKSFNEFFRRALDSKFRPIAQGKDIVVSPADGTILHFHEIQNDQLDQVKGVTYSLKSFFGPLNWFNTDHTNDLENNNVPQQANHHNEDKDYHLKLHKNDPNGDYRLYQCVIYLAPGDYHRFHSPTDWKVKFRRHFSGNLIGVKFANWIPGLFHINERVVYTGEWKHGFFSMTAVGATNVGSIKIYFDKFLRTNRAFWKKRAFDDKQIYDTTFRKGDPFGEFNLGSTIVLIFEAPKGFKFAKQAGDKIKYGELLNFLNVEDCDKQSSTE